MEIKKVGVVGCGIMGSGIAQVCAQSGYSTIVSEINSELLNKGMTAIRSSLNTGIKKGKVSEEVKQATLARLKGTTNMEDFGDCDLVIEAAIENLAEKKNIFAALDRICPQHAILATNTSCLSILDMAMATNRPTQVIGMHFFSPVPVMRLVEIVRTIISSQETIGTASRLGASLGKTVILAQDTPGFIVSRLLNPYLLDAIRLLESGVATKEDIDQGMVLGCNHPMGPLTLADLIGLDTIYYIACAMYDEFKDPKHAPPSLLKKMVTAGQLGRKSGKGFYEYKSPGAKC
jgi:3-hydroxybutyryl-CoA dehydrogenase